MTLKCASCGRRRDVPRRAAPNRTRPYICPECALSAELERRTAPAQAAILAARAEAYHRARALRHGGDKLNKRGGRDAW